MVGAADDDSDGTDAAIALGEHAWGKPTLARVEYKQGDVLYVTLFQVTNPSPPPPKKIVTLPQLDVFPKENVRICPPRTYVHSCLRRV